MVPSKKIISFTVVSFLFLLTIEAQVWEYSQHISATTKSELRGLTLDSDTNLYVTTYHKNDGTVTGPHGTMVYPTTGQQDILILKLQPDGDTIWTKSIYGTHSDYAKQVKLDNNEDIYVAGKYRRSALTVEGASLPLQSPYVERPADNGYDLFLTHYTSDGVNTFAKRVGWGPLDEHIDNIAVDDADNVYMVGTYIDTLAFGPDTLFTPTTADKYIFLAKFKPNGDFRWAKSISTTTTTASFLDIEINDLNEIYLSGFFTGDLNYDGTVISSQGAAEDVVLAKIDTSGTLQWMISEGSVDGADRSNGLTTDAYGSVYVTGYISLSATFDGIEETGGEILTSEGSTDIFLAKYNNSGTLLWASSNGDAGTDIAYGAKVRENLLQTTGAFAGEVIFNNDTLRTAGTSDQNAGFFVYDTDGNPITAKQTLSDPIIGTLSNRGEYIEYDLSGNTYIGGYFDSDTLFVGEDTLLKAASTHDSYVAKYINPFSATFSTHNNIICPGGNDGSLLVTTYFGTAPYIYEWSTNVISFDDSVATDLTVGDYWVKVTDVLGDTLRLYTTLTEPGAFIITTDSTNIICNGENNGTLLAGATGSTAPYTYNWAGQNAIPGDSAQINMEPGKYILTVTDANGCTAKDSVTLTQPEPITFGPVSIVIESPINSYTGKIFLSVNGGTPDYTYVWDSAGIVLTGENTDSLVNRTEGPYGVQVTDGNFCIADTSILLLGESFRVQVTGSDISCYGFNDGEAIARIVAGGDEPPFIFTWEDSEGTDITQSPDTIISDLEPGWYYVTAEDNIGATSIDSILIIQPDTLEIALSATNIDCYGDNAGAVTLTRTGGSTPVTYSWSNGENTQSVSSLTAGWYIVNAIDNNGCPAIDSAEVIQNDSLRITFTALTDILCSGGANGVLKADVTGGSGTYSSYQWDDNGSQSGNTAVGLVAGLYSVTVTDDKSCIKVADTVLTEPEVLYFTSVDSANVACKGSNDGSITVSMAGGTAPYTYNWSLGLPNSNVVTDLPPAFYSLTVVDANNCENDSLKVTIEESAAALSISEDESAHVDNICYDATDGSLTVIALDGWGTYKYSLNTLDWQDSPVFNDLGAQTYLAYVRDTGNCIVNTSIDITETTEITITGEQVLGNSIIIIADGGTAPLSYVLDGTGTPQESGQFDELDNGTYFVEVSDANDCGPVRSNDLVVNGTSINQSLEDLTSVYPNPTSGIFNLVFNVPEGGEFNLEIYSITGVRIYEETFFAHTSENKVVNIDLSDASSGIYMIKLNGIILSTKLVLE